MFFSQILSSHNLVIIWAENAFLCVEKYKVDVFEPKIGEKLKPFYTALD
jgi:hypothetical protein